MGIAGRLNPRSEIEEPDVQDSLATNTSRAGIQG